MKKIMWYVYGVGMILAITVVFICLLLHKESRLYETYKYPNEEFFGEDLYSEIDYKCTKEEAEIGYEIIDIGRFVLEYNGEKEDVPNSYGNVGALDRYYYFESSDAVSQKGELDFVTCKINGNQGHVWVVYSLVRYDEAGKVVNSSSNILSLWYVEKRKGGWFVREIKEAP